MRIYEKKNYYEKGEYESYTHKYCPVCKTVCEISEFGRNISRRSRLGWVYRSACYKCSRKLCKEYSNGNKPKRNERLKIYREKHPEIMKVIDRKSSLRHKYGITLEEYNRMHDEQNGKCFICHLKKKLVVDHCHKAGKVRKLLCYGCNTVLGKIEKGEIMDFQKYIQDHADILLDYAN